MAATSIVGSAAVIATPAALAVKDLKASCDGGRVSYGAHQRSLAVRASAETSSRRDVVKMAGAMLSLGLFAGVGNAKAGLVEDLLVKSAANKVSPSPVIYDSELLCSINELSLFIEGNDITGRIVITILLRKTKLSSGSTSPASEN